MKTPSRIFALILTFVLMMGASGCIFQSNKSKMLAHLREKYNGQEFVPIRTDSGGSWSHISTAILYCYPKGGDPEDDEVCATMNLDTKEFSDTYFGILIREDIETEILASISHLPKPMKVYCRGNSVFFDEIFDDKKTLADFKEWQSESKDAGWLLMHGDTTAIDPNTTIVTTMDGADQTEKEDYVKRILDSLAKTVYKDSYHGSVTVDFYPSEVFKNVTRNNHVALYKESHAAKPAPEGFDTFNALIYDGNVETYFHPAE